MLNVVIESQYVLFLKLIENLIRTYSAPKAPKIAKNVNRFLPLLWKMTASKRFTTKESHIQVKYLKLVYPQ